MKTVTVKTNINKIEGGENGMTIKPIMLEIPVPDNTAYDLGYAGIKDYKPTTVLETLEYYLGQLDAESDYLEMGDNSELYNNNTLQLKQQKVKELIELIKKGGE